MKANNRRLMWHGMFLFLLGLITGLVEQRFTNIRMGLSAHLEGVMNGIFLVALGAIWNRVRLPRRNDAGIRDGALWHLCELADHSSRGRFQHSCCVSYYGRRTQRETLARNSSHCRISEHQHFDRGRNCPCSLGTSGESVAGQRRLWMNERNAGGGGSTYEFKSRATHRE